MAEIAFSEADIERLAAPIADRVWEMISQRLGAPAQEPSRADAIEIVDRERLADILCTSVATIDRRVKAGLIPSIGDEHLRRFILGDVLKAMASEPSPKTNDSDEQPLPIGENKKNAVANGKFATASNCDGHYTPHQGLMNDTAKVKRRATAS